MELTFEAKWDKTLSVKDREHIKQVFLESVETLDKQVTFTPLWQAINHENNLLVTVLVHNPTNVPLSFRDKRLCYTEQEEIIAEHSFTIPTLTLQPGTSMPWTFIFPKQCLPSNYSLTKNSALKARWMLIQA
ncbi:SLAP domain-containing protein [Aquibacillus salsiterrae]|uniref:SLAP domain-containing protein n=1 Tax=Aquibacillus salsiterrae TaxID=2950439 RepID=A0A9X3WFA0_9BACI|nr:SLAP domain-containing protein [Aquibacillus salsiterrae]MDC3417381.1 SLAP domain-containing protein [Aquibacillus salsiterrae]